jgi:hypothetical protein
VQAENLTAAVVLPHAHLRSRKSLPPRPVWLRIVVASGVKKRLVKDLKGTTNDGN